MQKGDKLNAEIAPRAFQVIEAVGPSFTADHEDLNANSSWTADQGVRISLDVAARTYSKDEIRKFASQLHILIDTIERN